jgi:hypothetical protein
VICAESKWESSVTSASLAYSSASRVEGTVVRRMEVLYGHDLKITRAEQTLAHLAGSRMLLLESVAPCPEAKEGEGPRVPQEEEFGKWVVTAFQF